MYHDFGNGALAAHREQAGEQHNHAPLDRGLDAAAAPPRRIDVDQRALPLSPATSTTASP